MRTQTRYIQTHPHRRGADIETQKETTYEDESLDTSLKAANVVYTITGIVMGLISLRFLLLLFGANSQNPIAQVIYGVTQPLVAPFYGLFGTPYAIEGVRFELESVMAILFLAFIGWVIVRILTATRPEPIS